MFNDVQSPDYILMFENQYLVYYTASVHLHNE